MKTAAKPAKRQGTLTDADVKAFLANYKEAWEKRDADLAASLFTRDAHFKPDPFSKIIEGREAIHDYWAGAAARPGSIVFNVGTSVRSGFILAAEWSCSYIDTASGERKELAGMFIADFYGKQVRAFNDYWRARPK